MGALNISAVSDSDESPLRDLIDASLSKWWLPIPEELRASYLDFQYQQNIRFMLLINVIAHLAYLSYAFADFFMTPDVFVASLTTRALFTLCLLPVCILLIRTQKNLAALGLLPLCIVLAAYLWGGLLQQSQSPMIPTYQYAAVIFVMLLNIGIRVHFYTDLLTSMMLTAVILYHVNLLNANQPGAVLVFALVYSPVLFFSLFMSWHNTHTGRKLFLYSAIDNIHKADMHAANQKLWVQSHTDMLTGLPNRTLLEDRIQQAMVKARRNTAKFALLYIDLDKFKPINDTHGHAMGDRVLIESARRMSDSVRESDTVARIGGDEFVVLLPEIQTPDDALRVASKIRDALHLTIEIDKNYLNIGASIGIAIFPEHGTDVTRLVKSADAALYRAKALGRNRFELAEPQ